MAAPSGATPILGLPYPIPNDDVDVPRDIKALSDKLDANRQLRATSVLASAPVLDVGQLGQARAGRQITVTDFTSMGLSAPAGLWNLSDLTDVSGNARALTNKGAVPFGVGINGQAVTSAVFAGSSGQALYIADTGAADPFRIKTGSFGCWFRTAKRGTAQYLFAKHSPAAGNFGWALVITSNTVVVEISTNGSGMNSIGGSDDVADDRWHQAVATFDGTKLRIYVDGALTGALAATTATIFGGSGPLNIGAFGADGAAAAGNPHYGRVDEAFVTADVLSDDQVRALYCTRLTHGLGVAPSTVSLSVRRKRRGGVLAATNFPTVPTRLYNLAGGSLADIGAQGVPLAASNSFAVAGTDGAAQGALQYQGATYDNAATDAGLPAALAARTFGAWFKTSALVNATFLGWGTVNTADARLAVTAAGLSQATSGADTIGGTFVADGLWHHAVVVEDNAAADGVKRKLYLDGRLTAGSTVLTSLTLVGANGFRIGSAPTGIAPFVGQLSRAFVYAGALTPEQVRAVYNVASLALAASPKAEGDHVEALEATGLLATFDTIESSDSIDVGVAA